MAANRDNFGISTNYGMKIGIEATGTNAIFSGSYVEMDPDYSNNDFFFEEGNTHSKFMVTLSSYINYPL